MVTVTGGSFDIGSNDGVSDEKPIHRVTLSSFKIGKYEITQAQWMAVMGNNPSNHQGCDNCPEEHVSWDDIQEFLQKLNSMTGKKYRLPTEAEWEYAARGGNQSQHYTYAGSNNIDEVAWYLSNSGNTSHPVGQKRANELGIYDMSGNVWEWCSDWYGADYYANSTGTNPQGPSNGQYRVDRGGGWGDEPTISRATDRNYGNPENWGYYLGFRLVSSL